MGNKQNQEKNVSSSLSSYSQSIGVMGLLMEKKNVPERIVIPQYKKHLNSFSHSLFDKLPPQQDKPFINEILQKVASFLHLPDIYTLYQINKHWHKIFNTNVFWKSYASEIFGFDVESEDNASVNNWKLFLLKHLSSLEVGFQDIKLIKCIRSQGKGTAYLSDLNGKKVEFEVKRMRDVNRDEFVESIFTSITKQNHPSIKKLLGYCCKPPRIGLVLENAENGTLDEAIENDDFGNLKIENKQQIIKGICEGMIHLMERRKHLQHLYPNRIFFTKKWEPKISLIREDFTKEIRFFFYQAPEAYKDGLNTEKSNVFSFGLMIYMILFNKRPFKERDDKIQEKIVSIKLRPEVFKDDENDENEEFIKIMKKCWESEKEKRPTFKDILKTVNGISV